MNDIIEDSTSEWVEGGEDDDELAAEVDLKTNLDLDLRNESRGGDRSVSTGSQMHGESRHVHSKQSHQSMFGVSGIALKRDPTIESIIESRKSVVIENAYTSLAQITSRSSQHLPTNSFKPLSLTPKTIDQVPFSDTNDQKSSSLTTSVLPSDNDRWDDGLNGEMDKGQCERLNTVKLMSLYFVGSVASADKSSFQLYEERCKQLNICPSSMVIRSLFTTKINLENYGLGTKGSAALAVALLVISFYFFDEREMFVCL